jgi:hypothetical protein
LVQCSGLDPPLRDRSLPARPQHRGRWGRFRLRRIPISHHRRTVDLLKSGLTSAPRRPQAAQTKRGSTSDSRISSGQRSALSASHVLRSNWLLTRSAMSEIISKRSLSALRFPCMTTFQVSPSGWTDTAMSVGHSQMSSISTLMAASSSAAVLDGFFIGMKPSGCATVPCSTSRLSSLGATPWLFLRLQRDLDPIAPDRLCPRRFVFLLWAPFIDRTLRKRIHNPVHARMHPVLRFDPILRPARLIGPLAVLRDQPLNAHRAGGAE